MGEFHHRSTTKQSNKPFKGGHASKRAQKDKAKGKVEREAVKSSGAARKTTSKVNRRNAAKVVQMRKRQDQLVATRLFQGRKGAPKIAAVVPLCPDVTADSTIASFHSALGQTYSRPLNGVSILHVEQFKQRVQLIAAERNLLSVLDAAKVADIIIFVVSATVEVDAFGELLLSSILAQGVPLTLTVVQHLDTVPSDKQKHQVRQALLSYMKDWVPETEKVYAQDVALECSTALRVVTQTQLKSVAWRDRHAYMVVDTFASEPAASGETDVVDMHLTGFVRGSGLSANRLLYIPGFGDFQIASITSATPAHAQTSTSGDMDMSTVLEVPNPEEADDLVDMNEIDPMAGEQTWPTEEELAAGDGRNRRLSMMLSDGRKTTKRVPKGTSSYQAAWIPDDQGDGDDDDDDDGDDDMSEDGDSHMQGTEEADWSGIRSSRTGAADSSSHGKTHSGGDDDGSGSEQDEEYEDVDLDDRASVWDRQFNADDEQRQLDEYLQRQKEEREDLEFPDEVDTPMHIPARIRFQRYRGLKSFHKSPWDPYENLPQDYARLFQFENFRRTKARVLRQSSEIGVAVGSYVTVLVKNVPQSATHAFADKLFWVAGLLQYEHKMSTVNFTITRRETCKDTIKSKDPVTVQVGFRRFVANPVYSEHTKNASGTNNAHKFERFLRADRTSVATIYGPVTFGPCPVLMLKESEQDQEPMLVGTGAVLNCDPTRIIAKRLILTGHPYKIHKKSAVIRFMFFNPEDIEWFKPVQVVTKYGRTGHIRESLGTHGYMKCIFDGPIKQMDTICMYLYKRCFPKVFASVMSAASEGARWSARDDTAKDVAMDM
ncbi:ribosome biogenesis protein tsr1 [Sorochytrium milnesiophthora]